MLLSHYFLLSDNIVIVNERSRGAFDNAEPKKSSTCNPLLHLKFTNSIAKAFVVDLCTTCTDSDSADDEPALIPAVSSEIFVDYALSWDMT